MYIERANYRVRLCASAVLVVVASIMTSEPAAAQSAAVRCVKVHGVLLTESKSGWDSIKAADDVPANQSVLALFGAELKSINGAVDAKLVADIGQRGPFPVLESAARFGAPETGYDLDITVERGIVVLTNTKKSGAAKVKLKIRDDSVDLVLHEPKARVAIEMYGRLLPGMPSIDDAKKDIPVTTVAMFALEGDTTVGTGKKSARLNAPPGPALLLWDSVTRESEIHRHESLPDSVKPMDAKEKQVFAAICEHAKTWFADPKKATATIENSATSKDPLERKAAAVALGAIDMPRLFTLLDDKNNADLRDTAILAFRHWLGRESGQSSRLFEYLTKTEKYTPVQARNLVYLLAGIEEEKRRQPQTYVMLIQALNASKLPTRELARWHLDRLVPDSKAIGFNAAAPEETRLEKMAEYRKLVPEGELPKAKAPKKSSNP